MHPSACTINHCTCYLLFCYHIAFYAYRKVLHVLDNSAHTFNLNKNYVTLLINRHSQ